MAFDINPLRIFTVVLPSLGVLGLTFVGIGTGATTVDRYLVPPEILPGLVILYVCALLTALVTVKKNSSTSVFSRLKKMINRKIGEAERNNLRNMFLLLTFLIVAFSMTRGVMPIYREFATNYYLGLFTNIVISVISSIGLFSWLASLFISKQSKEK